MALQPRSKGQSCFDFERPLDPGSEAGMTEYVWVSLPKTHSVIASASEAIQMGGQVYA
jgi:hypothetical protein